MRHAIPTLLLSVALFSYSLISAQVSAQVSADIETAELTYPTEEHTISSTQQFWWTHIESADGYWLLLRDNAGNTYSDYTIHPQGTNTTVLYNLPDQPLTAELFTITSYTVNGGTVQNWDRVVYYHFNSAPAALFSPTSNQLDSASVTFSWNAVSNADNYYFHLYDNSGTLFYGGFSSLQTSVTIDYLPVDQRQLHTTLYTVVGDNWDRRTTANFTAASDNSDPTQPIELPPFWADFDYQIGTARTPADNVGIVSRDYTESSAAGIYNICYVNAFQSQPGEESSWPAGAVTPLLDVDWNEYLIDIRTASARRSAASYVYTMIDQCVENGYDAVEFDNLDTYTRLGDTVDPGGYYTDYWFEMSDAVAYAKLLTDYTHSAGLASAQKNTAELFSSNGHQQIGFDFAIVEDCLGEDWDECELFASNYDDQIVVIQYEQFNSVCTTYGNRFPIVKEDLDVVSVNPASSFCN